MTWANERSAVIPGGATARTSVEIDLGLRRYMLGIYNYMGMGLLVSAVVAYLVANTALGGVFFTGRAQLSAIGWVAVLSPLALLLIAMFGADRLSAGAIRSIYWALTALQGVSLAVLLQVYTGQSVTRTFFITAASFGALSLWGYTTQRDLSGMGSFLLMGLIGLVIAGLLNLFFASGVLQFIINAVGLLVFAGLTAFDTQRLKEEYLSGLDEGMEAKSQVFGALSLYLNFVNLFQFLLAFLGDRED